MYPELFSIGPITIYTHGVLLAVSHLLGLWLAMRRARKWGLDANRILDLGIYIIIAALIGASCSCSSSTSISSADRLETC